MVEYLLVEKGNLKGGSMCSWWCCWCSAVAA